MASVEIQPVCIVGMHRSGTSMVSLSGPSTNTAALLSVYDRPPTDASCWTKGDW